jgi:ATP-dependent DNA helicase RecG
MDTTTIEQHIRTGESLKVEFKGEQRESLSDREIYEAIVCLANTEGGVVLIGVENNGRVTGARPRHGTTTDPYRLQAAIFNNTEPPINTRVSIHTVSGQPVITIEVDPYSEICATKEGKALRRAMSVQGPECLPFYPYQHQSRRSDLGLFDHSAQVVNGATWDDLDPLEFERLRQTIQRRRGDEVLLALDDRQIIQALQLVESRDNELVPNVAGLLLLGRGETLRRFVPTHEVAFQVIDARAHDVSRAEKRQNSAV